MFNWLKRLLGFSSDTRYEDVNKDFQRFLKNVLKAVQKTEGHQQTTAEEIDTLWSLRREIQKKWYDQKVSWNVKIKEIKDNLIIAEVSSGGFVMFYHQCPWTIGREYKITGIISYIDTNVVFAKNKVQSFGKCNICLSNVLLLV